jgi:hypothetical protein
MPVGKRALYRLKADASARANDQEQRHRRHLCDFN